MVVSVVLIFCAAAQLKNGDPTVNDVDPSNIPSMESFMTNQPPDDMFGDDMPRIPPLKTFLQPSLGFAPSMAGLPFMQTMSSPMFPPFHPQVLMSQGIHPGFHSPFFVPTKTMAPFPAMLPESDPTDGAGNDPFMGGLGLDNMMDPSAGGPVVEIHSSSLPDFLADILSRRLRAHPLSEREVSIVK